MRAIAHHIFSKVPKRGAHRAGEEGFGSGLNNEFHINCEMVTQAI